MATDDISKFIMSILGVAFVLVIGLLVLGQFNSSRVSDLASVNVPNETVTWSNGTRVALAQTGPVLNCDAVYNNSAHTQVIPNTKYTCGPTGITFTDEGIEAPTTIMVNYTYKSGDEAYNATGNITTKLATVPTWIGIIITVMLAFIVLGFFYSRRM